MARRRAVIAMPKVKLVVAYDGTDFHGFARQQSLRTVQGTLETVLERVLGYPVEVFGSGRTDAGVHARAQVVHFEMGAGPPVERFPYLLRRALPNDIVCVEACEVDEGFHARFSAQAKTYRYTLQQARVADVFTNRYAWHLPVSLDTAAMERAAKHLIGHHDFTSFCAASTPVQDKRRTIWELKLTSRETYLDLYCTGNGFLQNMVRIVAGTLVDVGEHRIADEDVPHILAGRDRRLAGRTAPAHGLTLWRVEYESS